MTNLLTLAAELEELQDKLQKEASLTAGDLADAILHDLAYKTPVDTSRALSNWQVSLNAGLAPSDEKDPHFPGKWGSTKGASALATVLAGQAKLQLKKAGETIYLSNVVSYIVRLNQGASRQAPAGFVEAIIKEHLDQLDD